MDEGIKSRGDQFEDPVVFCNLEGGRGVEVEKITFKVVKCIYENITKITSKI